MAETVPPRRQKGPIGIHAVGHRAYVGGVGNHWEEIGKLQFDFLRAEGLTPSDVLVDVACGALRAGLWLIPWLETGHYLGIELEAELVRIGIDEELGHALYDEKRPEIIVDGAFTFSRFSRRPTYGIAQSLFTHLTQADIRLCLANLRAQCAPGMRFYGTYTEGDSRDNPDESHARRQFPYSRAEMEEAGRATGWEPSFIGSWGHPKDQQMILYRPA